MRGLNHILNKIELTMEKAYKKHKSKQDKKKCREILDYCILNGHLRIGGILAERYHEEGKL